LTTRMLAAVGSGTLVAVLTIGALHVMAKEADPLENYYGNTLVCAAAQTGNDLCHLWLNRNGTFINFDRSGGHAGHYRVGPKRSDGKVPVCQYWDTPNMIMPKELDTPMPVPPAQPGEAGQVLLCKTEGFRTTCGHADPAGLSTEDRQIAARSMGERFHAGMCYPLGPHAVGDIWFESDDPLPGQLGKDKLLLLAGHR
jgi:hypothetical protein